MLQTQDICTSEKASEGKGPYIRMRLEKTKIAPQWQNEIIELYLPIGGKWRQLTHFPASEQENISDSNPVMEAGLMERIKSLPPDERKVMECLSKNMGGEKRDKIDSHCNWKESKSQAVLKSLIDQGLILKKGNQKSAYYTINKNCQ